MSRCVCDRVVRRCCYFSEKRAERFVIFCAVAAVVVLKNGEMNWNKDPRMYSLLFFRKKNCRALRNILFGGSIFL